MKSPLKKLYEKFQGLDHIDWKNMIFYIKVLGVVYNGCQGLKGVKDFVKLYSTRRLMGSRIIESAGYCNQKLLALLYFNITQTTSGN
jgi:hypothetical protein